MKQTAGIYKITIGDEFYIGSSVNIEARAQQHKASLRAGKSPKTLQEAYNKHGEMHVDILEVAGDNMTVSDLRVLEGHWISREKPQLNSAALPGSYRTTPRGDLDYIQREIKRATEFIASHDYTIKWKMRMYRSLGRTLAYAADHALKNLKTIKEVRELAERNKQKDKRKEA